MASNLVKKIAQGTALFTGLVIGAAGFGGCSSDDFYREMSPINNLLPRIVQPGGHRDYVERKERERYENQNRMNGENQKQAQILYQIIDVETQKLAIAVVGQEECDNYILLQYLNNKFPEKGYRIDGYKKGKACTTTWAYDVEEINGKYKVKKGIPGRHF
ncbi:MAG: hypothetical protein KJ646_04315 [Nanoarchaeota archaeon]|nr:hypothetical protein [Nanoarchaeota archaeon]MBU4116616.1 hypothetical protein [Nanoarchaeota archaeon]